MALTKIDDRGLKTPIDLLDNEKIRLGTSNDFVIEHDGTDSILKATPPLVARSNTLLLKNFDNSHSYIRCNNGGNVELYHNNSKKAETYSAGLLITGTLSVGTGNIVGNDNAKLKLGISDDLQIFHESSSNDNIIDCATTRPLRIRFGGSNQFEFLSGGGIKMNDGRKIFLGDSSDLQIFHDGSNSFIQDSGTGVLVVNTNQFHINNAANNENMLKATENGAVELYYDNEKVLETAASKVNFKQRIQIHNDAPASGHGMAIGQWDGSNHRIEGDANRPIFITSYNSTGIKMGVSGANKVAINSHGIVFNGDTAAANALDDYEEGSFSVTLVGQYGGNASYSYRAGYYTRIGRVVHVVGDVRFNGSWSGNSGNVYLQLPFGTSFNSGGTVGNGSVAEWNLSNSNWDYVGITLDNNAANARFTTHSGSNNNTSSLQTGELGNGRYLKFGFTYITS